MNTDSKEFMAAVYTIIAFHLIVVAIVLFKRIKKKKKHKS